MIEGRIAGAAAACRLGFITKEELEEASSVYRASLSQLRQGMFAPENRGKLLEKTEEGVDISMNLLRRDIFWTKRWKNIRA